MNTLEIYELIKKNTDAVVSFQEDEGPTASIYVRSDHLSIVMEYLYHDKKLDFKVLMNQTGFHETEGSRLFWHLHFNVSTEENESHTHEEFRLFWHLFSYANDHRVVIESSVPIGTPEIQTVTSLWKSANWLERETYDLLGIKFIGHPDLRRIMLPEDWIGFPLRKDYEMPTSYGDIDNSPSEITRSFQPNGKKK